jgi:16S rRNA processing protein RimM
VETLVEVGSIRKTHGYAGEVKLVVHEGFGPDIQAAEFLFIGSSPEKALPYELKSMRGADWIAEFEELKSKEEAARLRGSTIYLRADEVSHEIIEEMEANPDESQKFVGFAIIDEEIGEIAMIEEVITYPQQEIAKLTYKGQGVLIPLNQALITGVDFTKKIVFMDLPEGILEL